jgi:hypothetical protein
MQLMNYASRSLLSFATFNAGWWFCALGPRYDMEWLGPASMPIWIGLHLYFTPVRAGEALFLAGLGVLGFAVDSLLIYGGLFRIVPEVQFTPAWLVCMWMLLGLTFESMLMARKKLYMVCAIGVMSGPVSYLFAQAVHILNYSEPKWLMISIHAAIWAALMPLLFAFRDLAVGATLRCFPAHLVPAEKPVAEELSRPPAAQPDRPKAISRDKR